MTQTKIPLSYTYKIEFSNEKRSFNTSNRTVLRLIEQAILHGLAPVVLLCTIQTVSDENGENRRDLSHKIEHSEDKSDLSNVFIYSIDSFPEDEISLTSKYLEKIMMMSSYVK